VTLETRPSLGDDEVFIAISRKTSANADTLWIFSPGYVCGTINFALEQNEDNQSRLHFTAISAAFQIKIV
jgi:hypothetical protein